MRINALLVLFPMLCVFLYTGANAQETILPAGGEASGSGGTASFSVGQTVYNTYSDISAGSVVEGVQQPYEISVVTILNDGTDNNFLLSAYPNPVSDYLLLETDIAYPEQISFELLDASGNILQSGILQGVQTKIGTGNLHPACYFIRVFQPGGDIKVFRIIKN